MVLCISAQGARLQSWQVTFPAFAQARMFSSGASTSWYTKEVREVGREKAEPLDGSVWDIKRSVCLQMIILMSAMWLWYLAKWYLSFCNYKLQSPWFHQLIKVEENAVMQQNCRHLVKDTKVMSTNILNSFPREQAGFQFLYCWINKNLKSMQHFSTHWMPLRLLWICTSLELTV